MKRRLRTLTTFNEVVEALGGPVALGKLTGQTCAAVCNWRRYRGLFPPKYWPCMSEALAEVGCSAPLSLWGFYGINEEHDNNQQAA
ncbi:hypothetical protein JQ604_14880 [Bradyrhizobium jicamae]|uniref:Uncharacterized protein n=1 Tax=Bradyrhizobium zhanjiangense TaxID=1325107 RepID=A0ABY0DI17_9BRAD|nr:hypothetical protein [Bradyrhizobium jicamae]MBR0753470.1 hypothetical protein [Bradyrhizobium jicamae]RXG91556.1 hypothetical protein EAS62_24050 [Bradyrhizobium zhanjiangense]